MSERIAGLGGFDSLTLVASGGKVAASVSERIEGLGGFDSLTLVATGGKVAASVSERIEGLGDRLAHARRYGREGSRERERADRGPGGFDSLTLVATGGKVAASVSERIEGLGGFDSLTLVATGGKVAASVSERIARPGTFNPLKPGST